MVPIERAKVSSYRPPIVTFPLSVRVSEILPLFTARCTTVQSAVLRSHVVHLSVRPSVTLVDLDQDHIGWKSWKLIAQTISPTPSLIVAQTPSTYSQGNMGDILGRKNGVVEHKRKG